MGTITFKLAGDAGKALEEYQKLIDKQQGVIDKLRQTRTASEQSTSTLSSGLREGASQALGFAAALTGIGSATAGVMMIVNQLKREYEDLVRKQREAAQTQQTVGGLRAEAQTMARPPGVSWRDIEQMVTGIGRERVIEEKTLWPAATAMLGARGGATMEQLRSSLDVAGRLQDIVGPAMDAREIGVGVMNLARMAGVEGPQAGAQALGWARQVGGVAGVPSLPGQMRALAPVIAAGRAAGATPEQAGELFAYFGQMMADPEGTRGARAAQTFMETVTQREAIPYETVERGKRVTRFRRAEGETFTERRADLERAFAGMSPEQQREMLGRMGGGARAAAATAGLLGLDREALATMGDIERRISPPTAPDLARQTEAMFAEIEGQRLIQPQLIESAFAQAREQVQLGDPGALMGQVREQMRKTLETMPGVSEFQRKLIMGKLELQTGFGKRDVYQAAENAFEKLSQETSYDYPYLVSGDFLREPSFIGGSSTSGWASRSGRPWRGSRVMPPESEWPGNVEYRVNPLYRPDIGPAIDDLRRNLRAAANPEAPAARDTNADVLEYQNYLLRRDGEEKPTRVIVEEDRRRPVLYTAPDDQRE